MSILDDLASLGGAWTYETESMPNELKAAMSPAAADMIGSAVSAFLAGQLPLGGMSLRLPESIDFSIRQVSGAFARLTPSESVQVVRPGFDVWLQHLDVYPTGKIVAEVKRFGFTIERDVAASPRMGLLSAQEPGEVETLVLTIVSDAEADSVWLDLIRKEASAAGLNASQAEAAAAAVRGVRAAFPMFASGWRRARKPTRRQAISAGMVAAGVPVQWRALWWVASYFIPAPIRALIDAVIWAVDKYIETAGAT